MKRYIYLAILMGLLIILNSCLESPYDIPPSGECLCSINADGTGFRIISVIGGNFGTPGLSDIYMTKDNRIIFYGEKLWISETDTIRPNSITDNIYTLQKLPSRLSQSPDGSKLYFASQDKNIYELDLNTMTSKQLTSETIRILRNPIVSDLGNYITYTSMGYGTPAKLTEYLFWKHIISGESGMILTSDSLNANAFYSETEGYVYYEGKGVKRSKLDGSCVSVVDSLGGSIYPYSMFSVSKDQRYITHNYTTKNSHYLRVYDKTNNTGTNHLVKSGGVVYHLGLGEMCKEVNRIYYVSPGYPELIHTHNFDTGEYMILNDSIPDVIINRVDMIAPTWDGLKIYFVAVITLN